MSMKRRKRRLWDDDEKHRIVAQTRVPGMSVSQVARRYDVNANLVFKWLRDPRFTPSAVEDPVAVVLAGRGGHCARAPAYRSAGHWAKGIGSEDRDFAVQ